MKECYRVLSGATAEHRRRRHPQETKRMVAQNPRIARMAEQLNLFANDLDDCKLYLAVCDDSEEWLEVVHDVIECLANVLGDISKNDEVSEDTAETLALAYDDTRDFIDSHY